MFKHLRKVTACKRAVNDLNRGVRRPNLERLEDRCVPATTWIGPAGGLWSNAANWTAGVPGSGASVQFGSAYGGTNTSSTDDIANLDIYSLTIDGTYGAAEITLDQNLTVSNQITQSGGIIATASSAQTLSNLRLFDWYGGELQGTGYLYNAGSVNPKDGYQRLAANFDILGGQDLGINVENEGNINWEDDENILMFNGAELTNEIYGIINLSSPDSILDNDTSGCYFVNDYGSYGGGTINVNTSGTVTIAIGDASNPNYNYGVIGLNAGGLDFSTGLQFYNGGSISESASYSTGIVFQLPYDQVSNADQPSYTPNIVESGPGLYFEDGATIDAGYLTCDSGTTASGGTNSSSPITIGGGGTVNVGGGTTVNALTVSGNVVDYGVLNVIGGSSGNMTAVLSCTDLYVQTGGTLNGEINDCIIDGAVITTGVVNSVAASTTLTINGSLTQDAGTINVEITQPQGGGPLVGGTLVVNAGNLSGVFSQTGTGIVNLENSYITTSGGFDQGATLDVLGGGGTLSGVVNCTGTIEFANDAETLGITGAYTQTGGTLDLQISGGSTCDRVTINGSATFNGGAVINVIGPPPSSGVSSVGLIELSSGSTLTVNSAVVNVPPPNNGWMYVDQWGNNILTGQLGLWLFVAPD